MDSLIISLHGNVNNSKFIKKIPMNLDLRHSHSVTGSLLIIALCQDQLRVDVAGFQGMQWVGFVVWSLSTIKD